MSASAIEQPPQVEAVEGMVLVDSRDGIAFTMTGEAAVELSERLSEIGLRAIGQRKQIEWKLDSRQI
jgi:hypothetical protein